MKNKQTLLFLLFMLCMSNLFAHIGIVAIRNPACNDAKATGEVDFYVNGTAGDFDWYIYDEKDNLVDKGVSASNNISLITSKGLGVGKYRLEVATQNLNVPKSCKIVKKEFEIKCCEAKQEPIDIVLEEKGYDIYTGLGYIVKT